MLTKLRNCILFYGVNAIIDIIVAKVKEIPQFEKLSRIKEVKIIKRVTAFVKTFFVKKLAE